jgi:hypothetical protein
MWVLVIEKAPQILTMFFFQAGIVKFVVSFAQTIHPPAFLASHMGSDVLVKQNANPSLQPTRG